VVVPPLGFKTKKLFVEEKRERFSGVFSRVVFFFFFLFWVSIRVSP